MNGRNALRRGAATACFTAAIFGAAAGVANAEPNTGSSGHEPSKCAHIRVGMEHNISNIQAGGTVAIIKGQVAEWAQGAHELLNSGCTHG